MMKLQLLILDAASTNMEICALANTLESLISCTGSEYGYIKVAIFQSVTFVEDELHLVAIFSSIARVSFELVSGTKIPPAR